MFYLLVVHFLRPAYKMLLEQTFTGWILGAEFRTSMKAEEDIECRKLKLETSESRRLGCLPKKRLQVALQID